MVSLFGVSTLAELAAQIHRELEHGKECTVYEFELIRFWSLNEKDRKVKIIQFAEEHGFRLRFYRMGWCAVFDKPR
jgi:hypothetical protein